MRKLPCVVFGSVAVLWSPKGFAQGTGAPMTSPLRINRPPPSPNKRTSRMVFPIPRVPCCRSRIACRVSLGFSHFPALPPPLLDHHLKAQLV